MSLARDAFDVLASQYPHTVLRVQQDGTQTAISKAIWLEDTVTRMFRQETQRTNRTGTLTFLDSIDYADTDQFSIDGEVWTQHHLMGLDDGLRTCHLQRDDKVLTGGASSHFS